MARLALGLLADRLEHLLQTRDLLFGLASCFSNAALSSWDWAAFAIFGKALRIFFSAK